MKQTCNLEEIIMMVAIMTFTINSNAKMTMNFIVTSTILFLNTYSAGNLVANFACIQYYLVWLYLNVWLTPYIINFDLQIIEHKPKHQLLELWLMYIHNRPNSSVYISPHPRLQMPTLIMEIPALYEWNSGLWGLRRNPSGQSPCILCFSGGAIVLRVDA